MCIRDRDGTVLKNIDKKFSLKDASEEVTALAEMLMREVYER